MAEKTILTPEDIAAIESVIAKGEKARVEQRQDGGVKVLGVKVRKAYERAGKPHE